MHVLGRVPDGVREVRADLDEQYSIRIGAGGMQLVDRGAGVQAEAHPAVDRHRGRGGHNPRRQVAEDRLEPTKVGRHEIDRRPSVAEEPLCRPEEPAAERHAAASEQLVQVGEQRTEHL